MRVLCEGCNTTYELPEEKKGQMGCPYCEHVNRAEYNVAEPEQPRFPSSTFDANKTVVAPMVVDFGQETTEAQVAIAGKPLGLSKTHSLSFIIVDGDNQGRRISITKSKMTMGRKNADILLNDPESSRHHCSIEVYGDLVMIRDLDSANGTIVNDQVIKAILLKQGDLLQIGTTVMKLFIQPKP